MEPLFIEGKDDTPEIHFNPNENTFKISGKSLPENVTDFYEPVYKWLEDYIENPNDESVFDLNIEYFNSASYKGINQMLEMLTEIKNSGKKILIKWHFFREDEDMLESGHDFAELTGLTFEYLGYD